MLLLQNALSQSTTYKM